MGFQFNQVGGGTKTRRPVALRMQYNPYCTEPKWFLVGDDGKESPQSLSDIQDYIERENQRLERDPTRSFDSREINLRMEYKHCPNMILIDTPGLIAAPRIPKGRSTSSKALAQQRALQASAREAEKLVVEKMGCEDYIILCVEDTSDWKHGATREVVQKADPELSRTVIVNTKFDTKIPQFGNPADVEDFLRATVLEKISPHKMGGPYFTSVPSGRVGRPDGDMSPQDYLYDTDEDFVMACKEAESGDRSTVLSRLRRLLGSDKGKMSSITNRVGLNKLRTFLEERVDECYRRNVRKIIPMLQAEYANAEGRLQATEQELEALSVERLKTGADAFCDEFCMNLRKAMHGTIVAPVTVFGETLPQESATSGSFHAVQGSPMAVSDRTWERLVESEVGNKEHRLYGGSQYHRTLREFHLATKCLRTPIITEDEIANAAGIGETHDGANFLHAACVIAVEKARVSFEPMLGALQMRMAHVMERLCPVAEYMLREARDRTKVTTYTKNNGAATSTKFEEAMDVSQNPLFRQLVRDIFERFVGRCCDSAMSRCRDDLVSMTKYVTWSLDERGSGALTRALPDQASIVSIYQATLEKSDLKEDDEEEKVNEKLPKKEELMAQKPLPPVANRRRNVDRDYQNLVQLMEEAFMARDSARTNIVVGGLVHHIVGAWREQFCREVTTKFNCYFMLPFIEDFHRFMRTELGNIYDSDGSPLSDVFDLTSVRKSLQSHRDELKAECEANKRLQEKFQICAKQMAGESTMESVFQR